MSAFFIRLLWLLTAVTAGISMVMAGNLLTLWLLSTPAAYQAPEPRAWTWDPFHNYARRA